MANSKYPYIEFSGAMQQRTTIHIKKPNEVVDARNVNFDKILGAMVRRDGAQGSVASLPLLPTDKPTLGAFIARYPTGAEVWAINNATGDATSVLKRWTGPNPTDWTNVQTGMLPNAETNFEYDLEEVWVSQYQSSSDTLGSPFTVDSTHSLSTTRQLQFAPFARFYMEFNGAIYAANASVGGTRYRDRLYKSSGPTGAITFARTAQTDTLAATALLDQVPTMTSNTTPLGTVAASSQFDATRQPYMSFDDVSDGTSRWITANGSVTGNISYDFGSGVTKIITNYSMMGAGPGEDVTRSPKTWTFEGSNNGSTWTTLDTQTTVPAWTQTEKRFYAINNSTAYRYYRINVSANQGNASLLAIEQLEFMTNTLGTRSNTMLLDSVRYIKPGMALDFYTAGTNNLLFTVTPTAVDKANDSITFVPFTLAFATTDVNTTTNVITLSSTSSMPTGTAVKFQSTTGLPAPLVTDTTYYVINTSGTTIQLATNLTNAQSNVPIDITTTGTGTHYIRLSYAVGNKDEVWASGRKGKLTRFWNTDYRTPESADWTKLPATLDGANDITGLGKISSRLFIFTENSMTKFDGQNITPLKNDVGCIAAKTIRYYDSFMVWLDAKGQVWIRNEEAGQSDIISIPIQKTLKKFTYAQLKGATAVCVGYMYKLTLGADPDTGLQLRAVYNFQSNQWTTEYFTPLMPVQLEYVYQSVVKPHFFDEHGQMWVDETGNDDNGSAIVFDVTLGDDNFGIDEVKKYVGVKVYSDNSAATKVQIYIDRGEAIDVGELTKPVQSIGFDPNDVPTGTLFNMRFINSATGDPVQIEKATVYYNREEDTFRATTR